MVLNYVKEAEGRWEQLCGAEFAMGPEGEKWWTIAYGVAVELESTGRAT